ncbi:helix-turn-helix transcriptional regulator [Actinoplanes sp. NPDC049599]|uniref:helix-turn-helix transcriptional regulator n=1 Tax=Actinoplanes sp. NPDC049599 TaxID=3363903 RepID=UPI003791524A
MARLKQLRLERGLTPTQLAAASRINLTQISRLESLERPPVASQVLALCHFYGLGQQTTAEFMKLAEPVRGDNNDWSRHDLETGTAKYLTFEGDATSVSTFQAMLVPGLLQAELYARAVVSSLRPYFSDEQIEETVRARLERRKNLLAPRSLEFHAVLDESVLLRALGGAEAMREQLTDLLEATRLPNVTVQILPLSVGPNPGLNGSFSLFSFGAELDEFAYVEDQIGQTFEADPLAVKRCRTAFETLAKQALAPRSSNAVIRRRIQALDQTAHRD